MYGLWWHIQNMFPIPQNTPFEKDLWSNMFEKHFLMYPSLKDWNVH